MGENGDTNQHRSYATAMPNGWLLMWMIAKAEGKNWWYKVAYKLIARCQITNSWIIVNDWKCNNTKTDDTNYHEC